MTAIYVMRHAEKPNGTTQGVDEQGKTNPKSLTPRGWERAGALAVFFGAPDGLPIPDRIFASGPGKGQSRSQRSLETLLPLAAKLNQVPAQTYGKGEEEKLVKELLQLEGTTLVCWQHEMILAIAKLLLRSAGQSTERIPQSWSSERFDVVWSFTRARGSEPWNFSQICQRLLQGDGTAPIG